MPVSGITGRPIVQTSITQTASNAAMIAAGNANQTIQVYAIFLVASATLTLSLTGFTGAMTMTAGVPLAIGPFIQPDGSWRPIFETAVATALANVQTGAGTVAGAVWTGTGPN